MSERAVSPSLEVVPIGGDGDDAFASDCRGRPILEDVTGRWVMLILAALLSGPQRYSRVRAQVSGISDKMLAQKLRALTRDGLISRTVTPTVPVQVSYELTDLGRELTPRLWSVVEWIGDNTDAILAAQAHHDATH